MHHIDIENQERKARRAEAAMEILRLREPVTLSDPRAFDVEDIGAWVDLMREAEREAEAMRPSADDYLRSAADEMADRAESRDAEDGERSMRRAVESFNALYGHHLTETQGWQFMSILKKARGAEGAYREDDYVDDIAYCALAAESAREAL